MFNLWPQIGLTVFDENGDVVPSGGISVAAITDYYSDRIDLGELLTYDPLEGSGGSPVPIESSGAPATATFVTLSQNANLLNERVLAVGSGLALNDGGANGNVTLSVASSLLDTINGKAEKTVSITAGAGLTGGGDLSASRTINVAANPDGSIIVNADDIQVGALATDTQHGNRGGGLLHAIATEETAGFMSPEMVEQLNNAGLELHGFDEGAFEDFPSVTELFTGVGLRLSEQEPAPEVGFPGGLVLEPRLIGGSGINIDAQINEGGLTGALVISAVANLSDDPPERVAPGSTGAAGTSAERSRADHVHPLASNSPSSGQVLSFDGTDAVWTAPGGPASCKTTSNQTFNTTSPVDITGLSFNVSSGGVYRVRFEILFSTTSADGINLNIDGPAMTACALFVTLPINSSSANVATVNAMASGVGQGVNTGGATYIATIEGTIRPSATGNFKIRARLASGSATLTILQGSNGAMWTVP